MRFIDYMDAFNRYDDAGLLRDFWTEDCVMQSGPRLMVGHKGMQEFLDWAHDGILETMRPKVVIEDGDHIFAEIDMDFTATRDRPDFQFAALKTGEFTTVKFFVQYTLRDGKVAYLKSMTWPPETGVSKPEFRLGATLEQRQAFFAYTRAFSNADFEVFPRYYTDDVFLDLGSVPPIHGRDGIVGFYQPMFEKVREHLTVHEVKTAEGSIFLDATSRFTAIQDAPDFVVGPLETGDDIEVRVLVNYELRDGLISSIRVKRGGDPVVHRAG
jgi:ketosteroid isomerase-like protein